MTKNNTVHLDIDAIMWAGGQGKMLTVNDKFSVVSTQTA